GAMWEELVTQWFQREERKGFASPVKGLPAKGRPPQIGQWVQRARTGVPDIPDVAAFAENFKTWWHDINPAWRKKSDPMEKKDGPWASMDMPGPNGFLNVLICLNWWRERLSEESGDWKDAVEDVVWVLKKM
ncbi:hypothetical protein DFH06DRAFT_954970, partial [Mycena polygramma]